MGISPEDQNKLFVPFERSWADSSDVKGTGLGLALAKRLVEAMCGTIGVQSGLGLGSAFWIELPLAEAPKDRLRRQQTFATALTPEVKESRTVLYVEDNVANLNLMEHILSYRPHVKLLSAMQGRLGLDLAFKHCPDLIFLDLHLPDLKGDLVLRQLRSDIRTRTTPTFIISADATPGQIRRLGELGATDYLTKPIDVEKFLRILDENLAAIPVAQP